MKMRYSRNKGRQGAWRRSNLLTVALGLTGCNVQRAYDELCEGGRCDTIAAASSDTGPDMGDSTSTGAAADSGTGTETMTGTSGSSESGSGPAGTTTDEKVFGSSSGDSESSDGSSSGGGSFCGDGVVDPGEDCDDPSTACNAACVASRIIFVTSGPLMPAGHIQGILGADSQCQKRAAAVGLPRSDRYRSWLSTTKFNARDRVEHHPGRYVLVTGEVVAEDFDELVSGQLQHAIDTSEEGEILNVTVWTGTQPDGARVLGVGHCNDWTVSELFEFDGVTGDSTDINVDWTQEQFGNPSPCDEGAALYCIEHP